MIQKVIDNLIKIFENGDLPKAIRKAMFPVYDVPMNKWSFSNQVLCIMQNTGDARGYKQWLNAGRKVKKGAKAIYILAPNFITKKDKDETGKEIKKQILVGFRSIPVFRVEDTEGEKLDYQKIEMPKYPLIDVAKKWGIDVKLLPSNKSFYGRYHLTGNKIDMCTPDESTFLHELSHASHHKILKEQGKNMSGGQVASQEIIAEFSGCVLAYIIGKEYPKTIGNTWSYIKSYSEAKNPINTVLKLINDINSVVNLILDTAKQN